MNMGPIQPYLQARGPADKMTFTYEVVREQSYMI